MKTVATTLTLGVGWLCLIAPAPAQTSGSRQIKQPGSARSSNTDLKQMYEDVAIMHLLLSQQVARFETASCMRCHQAATALPTPARALQNWMAAGIRSNLANHPPLPGGNGIYVPGQGVIFQVTLNAGLARPGKTKSSQKPKQLSAWEKARRQLRGETVRSAPKKATAAQPNIEEALLKVLADNGQHFSHLAPSESITIAVTFSGPIHPHGIRMTRNTWPAESMTQLALSAMSSAAGQTSKRSTQSADATTTAQKDYELLGNLHLKNGKAEAAIKYYEMALKRVAGSRKKSDLYRKLSQAYLQSAEMQSADNYRRALDAALKYLNQSQSLRKTTEQQATRKPAALPSRLIISASKSALEQIGKGRITLSEFRSAVRVQWLDFRDETGGGAQTKNIRN